MLLHQKSLITPQPPSPFEFPFFHPLKLCHSLFTAFSCLKMNEIMDKDEEAKGKTSERVLRCWIIVCTSFQREIHFALKRMKIPEMFFFWRLARLLRRKGRRNYSKLISLCCLFANNLEKVNKITKWNSSIRINVEYCFSTSLSVNQGKTLQVEASWSWFSNLLNCC